MTQQAAVFAEMGDKKEAVRCLREARSLWRALDDGRSLMHVATLFSAVGHDKEAAAVALDANQLRGGELHSR